MLLRRATKRTRKASRPRLSGESLENRNLMTGVGFGEGLADVPDEGVTFPEVEIHFCSTVGNEYEPSVDDQTRGDDIQGIVLEGKTDNRTDDDESQPEKAAILVLIPGVGGDSTID